MSKDKVIISSLYLAIIAVTAVLFRMASCQEEVTKIKAHATQCECLEPTRVGLVMTSDLPTEAFTLKDRTSQGSK